MEESKPKFKVVIEGTGDYWEKVKQAAALRHTSVEQFVRSAARMAAEFECDKKLPEGIVESLINGKNDAFRCYLDYHGGKASASGVSNALGTDQITAIMLLKELERRGLASRCSSRMYAISTRLWKRDAPGVEPMPYEFVKRWTKFPPKLRQEFIKKMIPLKGCANTGYLTDQLTHVFHEPPKDKHGVIKQNNEDFQILLDEARGMNIFIPNIRSYLLDCVPRMVRTMDDYGAIMWYSDKKFWFTNESRRFEFQDNDVDFDLWTRDYYLEGYDGPQVMIFPNGVRE